MGSPYQCGNHSSFHLGWAKLGLRQVDNVPKVPWLGSYGDKRWELGCPLAWALAFPLPSLGWGAGIYFSPLLFGPAHLLQASPSPELEVNSHRRRLEGRLHQGASSKYQPFCHSSSFFLQALPHEH